MGSNAIDVATPLVSADPSLRGLWLGAVRLVVRDLAGVAEFWRETVGLVDLGREGELQRLGIGNDTLIELVQRPDAVLPARRAVGLFHVALLLPTRRDLAEAMLRVVGSGVALEGAADHLVSEALYLSDPEGNGIELYWDRPRSEWQWTQQGVAMATLPLDLKKLAAEHTLVGETPKVQELMPEGTTVGHVHLKVRDVAESERWYREVLGLDTTFRMPSAAFMSTGGYHHHLGINAWSSQNGPLQQQGETGLVHYTIRLSLADREQLLKRLTAIGGTIDQGGGALVIRDPSGIAIAIKPMNVDF